MRRLSLIIIALLVTVGFAFSQEKYSMFENTYIYVKSDKQKEFSEAMAKHNKEFHGEGPYHVNVWMVTGGLYDGAIVNSMGPLTFTELDSRPDSKEHNEDLMENVMPYVDKMVETGYWKMSKKASYIPDAPPSQKLLITVYDIEQWQEYRFREVMEKVAAVYQEKDKKHYFALFKSAFDMAHGRDAVTVWGFDSYSAFDEDWTFKSDYEELHGEGSWQMVLDEYRAVVKGSVEEIWTIMPEMMAPSK